MAQYLFVTCDQVHSSVLLTFLGAKARDVKPSGVEVIKESIRTHGFLKESLVIVKQSFSLNL